MAAAFLGDGEMISNLSSRLGVFLFVAASVVGFSSSAMSAPVEYVDQYWGGTPVNTSNKDRIGVPETFEVSKAEAERLVNGDLSVRIYTTYAGKGGTLDTDYGALFIGDYVSGATGSDAIQTNHTNDTWTADNTRFKYALDFDSTPVNGAAALGTGGTASLFEIDAATDVQTSFANSGYAYRANQAVDVTAGAADTGVNGSWSIESGYIDFVVTGFFLNQAIATAINPNDGFIFSWAMTCANDIIYGLVLPGQLTNPVPIPAGFILLLSGLLGVGWLGRSRVKAE